MPRRTRLFTVGQRIEARSLLVLLLATVGFQLAIAQNAPTITTEPQNQSGPVSGNIVFTLVASGATPLTYRWYHNSLLVTNGGRLSGATTPSLQISGLLDLDAGDYQVTVSNQYAVATSRVALLIVNRTTLDSAFDPRVGDWVESLTLQLDGRLLVGGFFTTAGGQPRTRLARLLPDGSLDAGFHPQVDYIVNCVALQPDEKILLGGYFNSVGGQPHAKLARLLPDGTPDGGFNPELNEQVAALALQADGKILAGGYFNWVNGQARNQIARFNADGTLDNAFNPGANGYVYCLTLQPDGRILVGGDFTMIGGQPRNHLARLNVDGTVDGTFNPGADSTVTAIAVQADAKILVAGSFGTLGGQPRTRIGRLNTNGTADSTVFEGELFGSLLAMTLQADGKIMIGGDFSCGGQLPWKVARFNPDGQIDTSFDPIGDGLVTSLLIQPTGQFLVGGWYYNFAGQPRSNLVRLDNTSVATGNLSHNNSSITWARGGTGPEVWRTTFEQALTGGTWTNLGAGVRVAGGWQLTNLKLNNKDTIRARGFVQGGSFHGASWYFESINGPPAFTRQPVSQTKDAGNAVEFTAVAGGTAPIGYRWLKDGVAIPDGGGVFGAGTPTLSLSHVLKSNQGNYRVVVTNSQGSVTSVVAMLTVVDPVFLLQPTNQSVQAGQAVTLTVNGVGTPPLNYRWHKEGVPVTDGARISGAASAALTISNLVAADGGNYSAVVSNAYGMNTSTVATLTILLPPEITASPTSQAVVVGSNAIFSITATGTTPLSYQWQKDGLNLTDSAHIVGAASPSLGIQGVLGSDVGDYRVRVSNPYGSATSVVAALTVLFPPTITLQPTNQSADLAQALTIAAGAAGTAPLTFQWRHNGVLLNDGGTISGSTTPELMVSSITPAQAGGYDLVVSNSYGSVTSVLATVNVWLEPVILTPPASQYVIPTRDHTFTVVAKGAAPLTYQWFFSGSPLSDGGRLTGTSTAALAIQNVQATDAGGYTVVVSNSWGSVTSSVASLNLAAQRFVNVNNPTPAPPYTNWVTAATVIQDAINVSGIGDEILVTNGVYASGSVPGSSQPFYASHRVALNKPLTVISVNGPSVTTITGGGASSGRRCAYLTNGAVLAGFTLTGGRTDLGDTSSLNQRGAGALCQSLSSVISNCVISGNVAGRYGGGVYSGTLFNCTIANNTCRDIQGTRTGDGGGTYQSTLVNCVVASNGARYGGGGMMWGYATNCLLRGNSATWGGGAYITTLVNCTVVGNASVDDGGLGGASGGGLASGTAINSIIMFNTGGYGGPNYWGGSRLYSCTSPPPGGEGNISDDPLFVDSANGNYRLRTNSPCRNAGTNVAMTLGADLDGRARVVDGVVDMGAFEFQHVPWIVNSPQSQSVVLGNNAVFTLTAIGDEPFTYQWWKNGIALSNGGNLSGADAATLTVSNVALPDAGGYQVVIANTLGSATSSIATLTILFPPVIVTQPTNQTMVVGSLASVAVDAIGTAPLNYQWRLNGTNLLVGAKFSGTTANLLTISSFSTNEVGNYDVIIANAYGSVTSVVAVITALPLAITNQPVSRTAPAGTNVTFTVGVSGTAAFSYQWRFNQAALPGRTNSTLTLTNVQSANAGGYDVVITNLYAALTSSVATLTVTAIAPTILTQPVSRVFSVGQTASLSVVLLGSEPMTIQWQRNGVDVPGATNRMLAFASANSSMTGSYRAFFTNGLGFVISTNVTLTVSPVVIWGQTNNQQLLANAAIPATATNVIAIAAAGTVDLGMPCMALRGDGTPATWGYSTRDPMPPTNAIDLVAISLGASGGTANNLVLRADGTIINWSSSTKVPPAYVTNGNIVAIAAGGTHQLALRDDGTVVAWGSNTSGQTNVPPNATNIIAIAAGTSHSLALRADGTVIGWGLNTSGQATALSNAVNVAAIAAGGNQTMALLADGSVTGRIVTNTPGAAVFYGPPVGSTSNKLSIAAGASHSLAISTDRMVNGWGATNFAQTTPPLYLTNALAIAAAGNLSLALVGDPFAPPIPPRIGRPPFSRTVMAGQPAVFNALAIGGWPLTHQWLRNGVPAPGQTKPALIFANVSPADAGDYQLVALNEFGAATSTVATVTVTIPQPLLKSAGGASSGFSFTFQSIGGVIYVVEYKNDLNAAAWTELERRFGIGGIETVVDGTAAGALRLYRVRALYAPSPLLSGVIGGVSAVSFSFSTVVGANYVVQFNTNLNAPVWQELFRQSGTGAPIVVNDPASNAPSRFYRVKVE